MMDNNSSYNYNEFLQKPVEVNTYLSVFMPIVWSKLSILDAKTLLQ